ncbi:larval cuticle protein 65Ag1-like [Diabrotica virgifera virgifera]|uniref:Larval cuticle protein 65Ag1-like n=1 Tax=Diabrotica virgifera virgifera TaxID=50390 RepID=A0A6P7F2Q9_DIAVI|nr:larval cuticle protein 65Ag1-like [Diabrotica virgifera virgifera]
MKFTVVVFIALIALCVALPANNNPSSVIIRANSDVRPDGYEFGYETSDPIVRNEAGILQQLSQDKLALQVNGDFAFNYPEGFSLQTTYVADENGYRPRVSFGQGIGRSRN